MRTSTTDADTLMVRRFQALGEETRFGILELLAHGERCVCELQEALGAAQPRLSFHLRKLKEAGLVTQRREGRWSHYALVPGALEEVQAVLTRLGAAPEWAPRSSPDPCCD